MNGWTNLCLVAIAGAGCGKSDASKEFHYRIEEKPLGTRIPSGPDGAPILLDGKLVGVLSGPGLEITLPREQWLAERRITTKLASTCGDHEVELALDFDRADEKRRRRSGGTLPALVQAKSAVATLAVAVDNTTGTEPVTIRLGKWTHEVAAGTSSRRAPIIGDCPERTGLSIDGAEQPALPAISESQFVLVDPSGTRCYQRSTTSYVTKEELEKRGLPPPPDESFGGAKVHVIESVDHFLEAAPSTTVSTSKSTSLTSLIPVACTNPGK